MSVGSHYPFKRHRVPHFLPNHIHFSPFTPIFTHIFPVFDYVPHLWQFLCFGLFNDPPVFALFIFWAACRTPVMLLSLRGRGFGTQPPPKIGSIAKTFLLVRSLFQQYIFHIFLTLCKAFHSIHITSSLLSTTSSLPYYYCH